MVIVTDMNGILSKGAIIPEVEKDFSKLTDKDEIIIVTPDNDFTMNRTMFSILKNTKARVDFTECKSGMEFAYLCGKLVEKAGKKIRILVKNEEYAGINAILLTDGIESKPSVRKPRTSKVTTKTPDPVKEMSESSKAVEKTSEQEEKPKRKPREKKNEEPVSDVTEDIKEDFINPPVKPAAPQPVKIGKGKRPPMDDIRKFFEKYDTKDFKMSASAATIWDAFKHHLIDNKPIEVTLKDILLVDSKVDAVMSILSNKKSFNEIEAYVKDAI